MEVGRIQVVEAVGVQVLEHAPLHNLPRHPQQRPDERRSDWAFNR
jgi:hypothetical protein